jgi:hypothetical protein
MKRRIYVPEEKAFLIREDAMDDLEAHADWPRRGCDQTEQLRISADIKRMMAKVREHPVPQRTRLIDP